MKCDHRAEFNCAQEERIATQRMSYEKPIWYKSSYDKKMWKCDKEN